MRSCSVFPCLRKSAAELLAVWALLLAMLNVAYAETAEVQNIHAYLQSAGYNRADEENAQKVGSLSLLPLSDIPQREDRQKDSLKPINVQPDVYAAPLENRPGSTFIEHKPSLPEKTPPRTVGMFAHCEVGLLSTNRSPSPDETITAPKDEISSNRLSLTGIGEITYERSLVAGGDAFWAIAGDSSEGRLCEKNDGLSDRDQATGGVLKKDWSGIGRDTTYFVGYQLLVIGFLYVLPESVNGWTKEQKEDYDLDRWWKNVKNPALDNDTWYVNYLFHPYWGATYYIRARERGFDKLESFFYSAVLSTMYEFGVEALFEQPSYQDLIVTPAVGTLLGIFVFEPVRNNIKAKGPDQQWYDKLALVLTDPLGTLSDYTDKLFGVESSVKITYPSANKQRCRPIDIDTMGLDRTANSSSCRNSYTGLKLTVQW